MMITMKRNVGLILLLLIIMYPVTAAQENPNQKIVVAGFAFNNGAINGISSEVRYGLPPNLNLQTGTIKGLLLDAQQRPFNQFFIRDPRIRFGDAIGPGDSGQVIDGYTEYATQGQFSVILPFTPNLRYLTLVDSATGNTLATVDLSPAIAAFQQLYPQDPDMQSIPAPAIPENQPLAAAGLFIVGCIVAGISGLVYYLLFLRHRALRILIVDDDKAIVEVFSLLLKEKGYSVIPAYSGQECLSLLKKWWKRPDLILLDILMTPMDGWETLEEIKMNRLSRDIPVLMLTGVPPTPLQARKYGICIEDFTLKPVNGPDLFRAIESVLRRRDQIKRDIQAATKAGYGREVVCEYARLRRTVEVEKKLLEILRSSHSRADSAQIDAVYAELKTREEILNQLQVKLAPVLSPLS